MVNEKPFQRTLRKIYFHCESVTSLERQGLTSLTSFPSIIASTPCQLIKTLASIHFHIECIAWMVDVVAHFFDKLPLVIVLRVSSVTSCWTPKNSVNCYQLRPLQQTLLWNEHGSTCRYVVVGGVKRVPGKGTAISITSEELPVGKKCFVIQTA